MNSIGDLLQKKADNFDTDKADDLQLIQVELDRLFGEGTARASEINKRDELVIVTGDSGQMTTIRFAYTQIMSAIRNQTSRTISRIVVRLK